MIGWLRDVWALWTFNRAARRLERAERFERADVLLDRLRALEGREVARVIPFQKGRACGHG